MKTVKEVIDILSALNQDDKIWAIWVDKEEIAQVITDFEYDDENGNLLEVTPKEITNDFLEEVMGSVDNAEYVWDRFADELRDVTRDKWEELHNKITEAKEEANKTELEANKRVLIFDRKDHQIIFQSDPKPISEIQPKIETKPIKSDEEKPKRGRKKICRG
jgi:hypothetical protein